MKSDPYVEKNPKRPAWLDMIPVQKYKHFTRFYKQSLNGNGYYECFSNRDIDEYKGAKNVKGRDAIP